MISRAKLADFNISCYNSTNKWTILLLKDAFREHAFFIQCWHSFPEIGNIFVKKTKQKKTAPSGGYTAEITPTTQSLQDVATTSDGTWE